MTMDLLSLNDDVLYHICASLSVSDAFNFSITCKTARSFALYRTFACVTCKTLPQLQHISAYMLASEAGGSVPRAHYLQTFISLIGTIDYFGYAKICSS